MAAKTVSLDKTTHVSVAKEKSCVVYFGQDDSVINIESVRTKVGLKEQSADGLVCYCYGVTKAEAAGDTSIRDFVIEETKQRQCACETRNPSGRCCLADFPKV